MISPTINKPKIITVSQLNAYVKSVIDSNEILQNIIVTGEISNLTDHYSSGHIYFSLKDNKSVIRAVMFAGNARNLRFKPEEGMKVIVAGRVSLYEKTGSYQLYVEGMQPDGIGELALAYEQLKTKLEAKGLFAKEHKKSIPRFPKTVGVITSPTGAVIRDIQNVISRRYPYVDIVLCPVLVQGENAAPQLINAVNKFNEYDLADVIIIGRGGGSIEDLWPFNDENLAYSIYASNIPIISAVGHETDFTICDFVSDLRAPTPSAAAELAVPDKDELRASIESQQHYLFTIMDSKIIRMKSSLKRYEALIESKSPSVVGREQLRKLNMCSSTMRNALNTGMIQRKEKLNALSARIEANNPLSVLKRGYSVIKKDDKYISHARDLRQGDSITITLQDGEAEAQIKDIKEN